MGRANTPPRLYAWDVGNGHAGVTDDMDTAFTHVDIALHGAATGVCGAVRLVTMSTYGKSEYIVLGIVGQARRDDAGVMWTSRWGGRPPGG